MGNKTGIIYTGKSDQYSCTSEIHMAGEGRGEERYESEEEATGKEDQRQKWYFW